MSDTNVPPNLDDSAATSEGRMAGADGGMSGEENPAVPDPDRPVDAGRPDGSGSGGLGDDDLVIDDAVVDEGLTGDALPEDALTDDDARTDQGATTTGDATADHDAGA